MQILFSEKYVSRSMFCEELYIGEGAVKTLISHLKESELVDSTRAGTFLTKKGQIFSEKFFKVLSDECQVRKCNVARSQYNHAVILRGYSSAIKSGMEQRDYSILYGATGATTLIFTQDRFIFPGEEKDCLTDERKIRDELVSVLNPKEGDVVIIASSDDPFVAEISAKNSALWTMATHR